MSHVPMKSMPLSLQPKRYYSFDSIVPVDDLEFLCLIDMYVSISLLTSRERMFSFQTLKLHLYHVEIFFLKKASQGISDSRIPFQMARWRLSRDARVGFIVITSSHASGLF